MFEVTQSYQFMLPYLREIIWINAFRLKLIATFLAIVILIVARTSQAPSDAQQRRREAGPIFLYRTSNLDPTRRIVFTDNTITIYGWPSRGGVIILREATIVDFDFLGLSTIDPPRKRNTYGTAGLTGNPNTAMVEEDSFCQRMLLLGATWFDSEVRYQFFNAYSAAAHTAVEEVDNVQVIEPTLRERRWVKVGWEGPAALGTQGDQNAGGGLWVLDCEITMPGICDDENLVPEDAGKLALARSMEERCQIMKMMGAKFYHRLEDFENFVEGSRSTFLRAWEWKYEGEVGELVKV
ncbi:MAG: hypothetical protein Q9213_000481 [Squamulea squamosa]